MPKIFLKKVNNEVIDRKNDKDVLIELFTLIITKIDNRSLSIGYRFVKDRIIYNKVWNKTEKLLISDKVKKSKIKENEIDRSKINSNMLEKNQMQGNGVGKNEIKRIKIKKSEI